MTGKHFYLLFRTHSFSLTVQAITHGTDRSNAWMLGLTVFSIKREMSIVMATPGIKWDARLEDGQEINSMEEVLMS